MGSTVNVTATLIADAMGIFILICVVFGNMFLMKERARKDKSFAALIAVTFFSCLFDGINALADGRMRIAVIVGNTLVYLCGPVTAVSWIFLVTKYIKVKISKLHKIIIGTFCFLSVALIIANLFTPILFTVNGDNVYQRVDGLYMVYSISYFGLMADAVVIYLMKKYDSGGIKFFPMWSFIAPILVGMLIQNFFFGVSAIAPFMAISIASMFITFQNNLIFKDQLTDLYNRYYLVVLEKRLRKKRGKKYSVIMLDINDFKSINDIYGHDAGDEALMHLSEILISVVDKSGEIIRYAGDEFIIVLNLHDDDATEALIAGVRRSLEEFGKTKTVPYELSVAVGWCRFSFDRSLNEFITEADRLMYANKQEHYKLHPKHNANLK